LRDFCQPMRLISRLIFTLFVALAGVGNSAAAPASRISQPAPTFYGSSLGEVGVAYHLTLEPNRPDVTGWQIDWGDGSQESATSANASLDHPYRKPGRYVIHVQAKSADGMSLAAQRDYGRVVLNDRPAAATDLPSDDSAASPATLSFLAAIASNLPAANPPAALHKIFSGPVDRFSVECWLRLNDLTAQQELLDASGVTGHPMRLYLQNDALHLLLAGGCAFDQPLGAHLQSGTWHHVALTYDRDQTFPFSNVARFYVDGTLIGEHHLDIYDTGPVTMPAASVGAAADGTNPINGSIAELAIYDRWLNPAALLDRVVFAPGEQVVVIAPKNAETFTVDQPRITTTVDVALSAYPNVDNGPALRAAIDGAAPGTRVRVVNAATNAPGGRFYFNSLETGRDWTELRVSDKTDFELDGGDADFVFRTDVRQLSVKHCTRTAFRHFNIDLDQDKFRPACYAKILDVDASSGTIRLQFVNGRDMTPDRKVPPGISMWRWRSLNPKTLRILGEGGLFFQTYDVFGKTLARDPADQSILIGHVSSARMLAALEKYRRGANFLMVNNAEFRNTSASLWQHCSHITFDHVNFYSTLGVVFLSSDYDHLWVTHCRIGLPPGLTAADRPLASGADGYHFHENQGFTLFEDNEITLTDDDPISIKDGIWRDVTSLGNNTIHIDGFHVGEEIELYKNDLSPLHYTAHVTAVSHKDITVDTPLPANLPKTFLAQNHRERSFNWVLKDSYFHDFYGRFLVYTPWARITGNQITRSYLHIGTGAASFDGGGISSNVLVDDNVLIDTPADTGLWGIRSSYPVFQNITFAGNSFIGAGLTLSNTGAALVADNYFEPAASSANQFLPIRIRDSVDPRVVGNQEAGTGLTTFGLKTTKTDGLTDTENAVVVFPADPLADLPARQGAK
jgi:hypothetical protein